MRNQLFYNQHHEYEVDRIKKVNKLIETLTGKPVIEFIKHLHTIEDIRLVESIYYSHLTPKLKTILTERFNEDVVDWNSRRDWRKLDVFMRSMINGWLVEDATHYYLINNGVDSKLNELPREFHSNHSLQTDLIVNGVPVEVMVHYYNFIQEKGEWLVKKYKFDFVRKVNGLFLLYDLYDEPRFMIIDPNNVEAREEKKLIGGKRGYIVRVNPEDLHPVSELSTTINKLTNNTLTFTTTSKRDELNKCLKSMTMIEQHQHTAL